MAFRKKLSVIDHFDYDIAIIQECEQPEKVLSENKNFKPRQCLWFGDNKNKGVGVFNFSEREISVIDSYSDDYSYIIPLRIGGANDVVLFAVWAMPHVKSAMSYVWQVWSALHIYKDLLDSPCVLIGDFNSNAIWDKKYREGNHSALVTFLLEHNISSLYHSQFEEDHGNETHPTFFLYKSPSRPYHMDYCFVSHSLLTPGSAIEIGKFDDWISYSDHMPLLVTNLSA